LEGRFSDESSYNVYITSFVDKKGNVIPAIKYYKPHYQIENGIEFVCLLKANRMVEVSQIDIAL
jgi:hypothetical protein